jgi:hypothetical protein
MEIYVIRFVSTSVKSGISAADMDLNGTLECAHLICVPLRPMSVLMPNLALVEAKHITGKLYFLKMENFL